MNIVREWHNEAWDCTERARTQGELQYMAKAIIRSAERVENNPTPGYSKENLSRVLTCTSSLSPKTKYIIHLTGFTVEDIVEIVEI